MICFNNQEKYCLLKNYKRVKENTPNFKILSLKDINSNTNKHQQNLKPSVKMRQKTLLK